MLLIDKILVICMFMQNGSVLLLLASIMARRGSWFRQIQSGVQYATQLMHI